MKIIDIPRSGSVASDTSSRNRAGQYVRNRRAPTQPLGTGRRAEIRAAFGSASQGWSGLTDAQRSAWIGFADTYPYVDSLGQTIKLTGHQLYVAIGTQLLNCGQALPTNPPGDTTIPVITDIEALATAGSPELSATFATTGTAADFLLVQVSPQMSAGRSFNGRWWQAAVIPGNDADFNVITQYVPEFGALVEGRKVFLRLTPVNQYGCTGASTTVAVTVGA
jgi:hypothetical protein